MARKKKAISLAEEEQVRRRQHTPPQQQSLLRRLVSSVSRPGNAELSIQALQSEVCPAAPTPDSYNMQSRNI